jgi:predicted  nucleic acid-binding Zn-ribbon protein
MTIGCNNCGNEFSPKRTEQKYCSAACRVKAFNVRKNAILTHQINANDMDNINALQTDHKRIDETLERILNERQQVFETKLRQIETDYEKKLLELRLTDLEKKVKDLEKAAEESAGGIKMTDVMAGVGSYFATQMSSKTETPKQ